MSHIYNYKWIIKIIVPLCRPSCKLFGARIYEKLKISRWSKCGNIPCSEDDASVVRFPIAEKVWESPQCSYSQNIYKSLFRTTTEEYPADYKYAMIIKDKADLRWVYQNSAPNLASTQQPNSGLNASPNLILRGSKKN